MEGKNRGIKLGLRKKLEGIFAHLFSLLIFEFVVLRIIRFQIYLYTAYNTCMMYRNAILNMLKKNDPFIRTITYFEVHCVWNYNVRPASWIIRVTNFV